MPVRLSLTKSQRASVAGAELLSLCQTITEDGRLFDEEIAAIQQWCVDHAGADLPARAHLNTVIQQILADGVVTDEERRDLQLALEKVLPPELRQDVKAKRQSAEQTDALRDMPVEEWDFMVAGVRYEGRPEVIQDFARHGDPVALDREPHNRFSRNAVAVRLMNGLQIGYVPETHARYVANHLDGGRRYRATIKKILTGGRAPIPVVIAGVFSDNAKVEGLRRTTETHRANQDFAPVRGGTPEPSLGWIVVTAVGVVAVLAVLVVAWLT